MRILFFSHYYPPEGNAPATRVHAMARRWVAAGHEVTVVTGVPNVPNGVPYEGYRNRLRPQHETRDGVRVVRVWTRLAPNRGTFRRTANYLSYLGSAAAWGLARARADVVVATSPQFFCGWAGAVVARLRRRPFVLEIRDLWPDSIAAVEAAVPPRMLRLLLRLERALYRAAGRVVTVGDGYRDALVAKGVPADRIDVIPNGVDDDRMAPRDGDPELRARWRLGERFVCSYVGTIGLACGLDVVLDAAESLRREGDARFVFLLVGDGARLDELRRRAAERGVAGQVVFAGLQPKAEIPRFLAASDACLVHLRKTELFETVLPSKIFEAAGMARPVVCAVPGRASALVAEAGAGPCIPSEDPAALVAALRALAADPAAARRMGEAGRAFVRRHYRLDDLARRYLAALAAVAGVGPSPCDA